VYYYSLCNPLTKPECENAYICQKTTSNAYKSCGNTKETPAVYKNNDMGLWFLSHTYFITSSLTSSLHHLLHHFIMHFITLYHTSTHSVLSQLILVILYTGGTKGCGVIPRSTKVFFVCSTKETKTLIEQLRCNYELKLESPKFC
jgi:hypothetical protein